MSSFEQPRQTQSDLDDQQLQAQATEVLRNTAPELLTGELPAVLQRSFMEHFGPDKSFALGINQSQGMEDIAGAEDTLKAWGGVSLTGDETSFGRRFVIFDSESAAQGADTWLAGYYGPSTGRLIVVFPVDAQPDYAPRAQVNELEAEALPKDFLVAHRNDRGYLDYSVAAHYVAGFIDDTGFHANQHFLESNIPPQFERTA